MEHVIDVSGHGSVGRLFERCFPREVPVAPGVSDGAKEITTTSMPRAAHNQPCTSKYRNPSGHYSVHGATAFANFTAPATQHAVASPMLGDLRESSSQSAAERHEEPHCYICLSTEGPLLVGVCACRWMAVHTACLRKQYHATKSHACRVCLKEMVQLEPDLWSDFPSSCTLSALGAACEMLAGLAVLGWWMLLLVQQQANLGSIFPASIGGGAMLQHGWITLSTLMRIRPGKLRCLFTDNRIARGAGGVAVLFTAIMLGGLLYGAALNGNVNGIAESSSRGRG